MRGGGESDPSREGRGGEFEQIQVSRVSRQVIIFGSPQTLLIPSAWIAILPVSAFTSLCRPSTSPPFLHASVCSIVNLALQPSHHWGMSTNPNPYLLRIASRHSSLDKDRLFTKVGWTEIQAPVSVLRVVCQDLNVFIGTRREESSVAALAYLEDCTAPCPSCIATW